MTDKTKSFFAHCEPSVIAGWPVISPSSCWPVRRLAADSNLTWKADVTVKETYDNNVYLQDNAPAPGQCRRRRRRPG